jgi:hypothetical protein
MLLDSAAHGTVKHTALMGIRFCSFWERCVKWEGHSLEVGVLGIRVSSVCSCISLGRCFIREPGWGGGWGRL